MLSVERAPFVLDLVEVSPVRREVEPLALERLLPAAEDAGLQLKIVAEDKVLRSRIDDAIAAWDVGKPIQGSFSTWSR
jgi:hypothetical protein